LRQPILAFWIFSLPLMPPKLPPPPPPKKIANDIQFFSITGSDVETGDAAATFSKIFLGKIDKIWVNLVRLGQN